MFYRLLFLLGLVAAFHWVCRFASRKFRLPDLSRKAVLITGCDSGFGKSLAKQLAAKGIQVYAACLTPAGQKEFEKVKGVTAIPMDVSSEKSVHEAYALVSKKLGNNALWGIVNNAGVLRGGAFECTLQRDWHLQFNVNVIGLAHVTQVFLPLLRRVQGSRIVNISSVAGRFSMPGTASYSATKYAVQGLSDALRREMKVWGIKVIIIEPGVMKTPLWDVPFDKKRMQADIDQLSPEVQELYGMDYFEEGFESSKKLVEKLANDPQLVVDVLEEALTTKYPLTRYTVGKDSPLWIFLSYAPTWLSDFLLGLDKSNPIPAALKKKNK